MKLNYSTTNISAELLQAIANAIRNKTYGSVEIYIQNSEVTQITERVITKLDANSKKERVVLNSADSSVST